MEIAIWIILAGVALIDGKIWAILLEQRRHSKAVEQILAASRERGA